MNEIAARAVYLYAFSAGPSRGGSGVPELLDDRRNLISPERARLGNVLNIFVLGLTADGATACLPCGVFAG